MLRAIPLAALLCLFPLTASSQEVSYQLSEGSSLTTWPWCADEGSNGELRGTFVAVLAQSHRRVNAAIVAVDFHTLSGPDYHFTGEGVFSLFAPPGATACLPAAFGVELSLRVNDSEDIFLTTELGATETFPEITAHLLGDRCFEMNIRAAPRPEDAVNFFRRGDANGDARVDISDAISILNFLFLDGPTPGCLDATDANDDGKVDIADPIALLHSLLLGTDLIRVPSCFCGLDPTEDALGCNGP